MSAHPLLPGSRWRIESVEVIERFESSTATVARARVHGPECPRETVIVKRYREPDREYAAREIYFHTTLVGPATPSAALLDIGDQELLLIFTDLRHTHRPVERPDGRLLERLAATLADAQTQSWNSPDLDARVLCAPRKSVARLAAAWPADVVADNSQRIAETAASFVDRHRAELTADERALVIAIARTWGEDVRSRVEDGGVRTGAVRTLVHGDLHLAGNVFDGPDLRFIDWADCAPGLPAYDLAYALGPIPAGDRVARDRHVLGRYRDRLSAHGIDYPQHLARWDFRHGMRTALLQSVLQDSVRWCRTNAAALRDY